MPVTIPRKQLLICNVFTSPVHTVTILCYGTRKRYKCVLTLYVSKGKGKGRGKVHPRTGHEGPEGE
jgi:hypothetical protein